MNDFCAHENPSHTAIATRPAKASDIRYTVMPVSFAELFALVHAWIFSGHSSIFAKCISRWIARSSPAKRSLVRT
jgi:hypothetical protein